MTPDEYSRCINDLAHRARQAHNAGRKAVELNGPAETLAQAVGYTVYEVTRDVVLRAIQIEFWEHEVRV